MKSETPHAQAAHQRPTPRAPPPSTSPRRARPTPHRSRGGRWPAAGEWVVDLRSRVAFAEGHVAGPFDFEGAGRPATYLAWLIPWGEPVTLLADTPEQIAAAQRELVRVGIDRPAAAATGEPRAWVPEGTEPRSFPRATFADLAAHLADVRDRGETVVVLDVRRRLRARGRPPRRLGAHTRPRTARPYRRSPRGRGVGALRGRDARGDRRALREINKPQARALLQSRSGTRLLDSGNASGVGAGQHGRSTLLRDLAVLSPRAAIAPPLLP